MYCKTNLRERRFETLTGQDSNDRATLTPRNVLSCWCHETSSTQYQPCSLLSVLIKFLSLVDPTLAAFIKCSPLQFLVSRFFCGHPLSSSLPHFLFQRSQTLLHFHLRQLINQPHLLFSQFLFIFYRKTSVLLQNSFGFSFYDTICTSQVNPPSTLYKQNKLTIFAITLFNVI